MDDETAATSELPIFRNSNGTAWNSRYFRTTYLWPSLHEQRLQGESSLQAFDGSTPGMSIPEKFSFTVQSIQQFPADEQLSGNRLKSAPRCLPSAFVSFVERSSP